MPRRTRQVRTTLQNFASLLEELRWSWGGRWVRVKREPVTTREEVQDV